jgi:16S rRNA (guanine527-N7)-methyltransferase
LSGIIRKASGQYFMAWCFFTSMIQQLSTYFPDLTKHQLDQLTMLKQLYFEWNNRINLISRKDIDNIEIHHILHSLSIAIFFSFHNGERIMDAGTGGGFPGIPLAILFPEAEFTLVDSIAKKISVVEAIKNELGLHNVIPLRERIENVPGKFDFITGRAVTTLSGLISLVGRKLNSNRNNNFSPGLIYLKGGDFNNELTDIKADYRIYNLNDHFNEPFFESKKLVHLFNLFRL